ncbi:MAG TPA: long-chain-fatty-acid--CoA ligase [Acidimicrobiales bacterium]|nr:long-chain-fatty-acid--CoA ligase [Acidimicrobiales bacterium]
MSRAGASLGDLLLARLGEERPGLKFEDGELTWDQYVQGCLDRASLLADRRREGPFHVGVLLDNVPDFVMLLGAAAIGGATVVGLNPTRRGSELADDIVHTDCQLLVTEPRHRALLDGLDLPLGADRILDVDDASYQAEVAAHAGAAPPPVTAGPDDLFLLVFTSGTSGRPKAVKCSQQKVLIPGRAVVGHLGLTDGDTSYLSMPLFHSASVFAGWSPSVVAGCTMGMRRRFSASAFLDDVRRFGCTWFNYIGKPLAYVLATPERPDDADNPLRIAMGNETTHADAVRFAERFDVVILEGYGATESGLNILRTPDTPDGAMGPLPEGVAVIDTETGEPCPVARFDAEGKLVNGEEAIGEMVNTDGPGLFQGYYRDEDAVEERMRGGMYRSGDLAYVDVAGFAYFAGRTSEWLRVDGENLAAAPIERLLLRHSDVAQAAVYAVPNVDVGDEVMAALVLEPGATFDPVGFADFLAGQSDLGTKWAPRYVRLTAELPHTATNKVLKRTLIQTGWQTPDPVYWRAGRDLAYREMTAANVDELARAFAARDGRSAVG